MTLFITDPLSLKDAVVSIAVESPALAQGDFLLLPPRFFCPVCSWSGDTCRECPACGAADVVVVPPPQLQPYAALIRKHGLPLFIAHLPPGMSRWGDKGSVKPFWFAAGFDGYIAALRARGYRVAFPSLCVASVLPPERLGAAS